MKLLLSYIVFIFLTQCLQAQNPVYLDDSGNEIRKSKFYNMWRNDKFLQSRWDSIGKNGLRYCTLNKNQYITGEYNYSVIKNQLEKTIGRKIENDKILLLEYIFENDLCTADRDNHWSRAEIIKRKKFLNPTRDKLEVNQNIIYICLFEESIALKNNVTHKHEYFFTDLNNYFRKHIFKDATLCGSFALIKPNGETLIRNGEYGADPMSQHLKYENWSLFFPVDE